MDDLTKHYRDWGRGGGRVVNMLAIYSNNPSMKPAETYSFFSTICV